MTKEKKKKQIHFQLHPKQAEVFNNKSRFRVVVAGRRWGKSKLSMLSMLSWATRKNQKIWYVAPTYKMAKQIMWNEIKTFVPREWVTKVRENELSMEFRNGSRIDLKGADKPDSLRGVSLDFLVLDEFQDISPDTWKTVLRPTLADRKGHALFIGTPKSYNLLYEVYRLGQNVENRMKNKWMSWQFPTITSPFIPKAEIETARRDMDEKSFRQEFCHLPDTQVMKWDGSSSPLRDLNPGDTLIYIDEDGVRKPCSVIDQRKTGMKEIVKLTLETGEIFKASEGHKMRIHVDGKPVERRIEEVEWIERSPVFFIPRTEEEKLAALVGYSTGDGNIAEKVETYTKRDGTVSEYKRIKCSFFSNDAEDLEWIREDLKSLELIESASVCQKKNKKGAKSPYTYQLQAAETCCRKLVELGAPVGKKTDQSFRVPSWVMNGSDSVKRSYLGALFGAEGTTPSIKGAKSHYGRMPQLSMSKINDNDGMPFFKDLQQLAEDLGVSTTIRVSKTNKYGKTFTNYWLSVKTESIVDFYEKISYVYSWRKAEAAWKFATFIHTYEFAGQEKGRQIKLWRENYGFSFYRIGKMLGIGTGGVYNLYQRLAKGEKLNAGHGFPVVDDWLAERWDEKNKVLRIKVVSCDKTEPTEVYNITVDSPDHSYLLADGTDNYNCASFESMSGRVYYAFDRKQHVANVEFNPKLPIWVGMDFNIDPMSTVIFQPQPNGQIWAVDEIVQVASNTDDICTELEKRYYKYQNQVTVYPDPAGSARQHARGESDLDIIREHGFKRIKVKRAHSAVADRINAVNRVLRTASGDVRLFINPKCKHLIESFEQTLYIAGTRDVDKALGVEHSADAAGYCIEIEFPLRKFTAAGYSR